MTGGRACVTVETRRKHDLANRRRALEDRGGAEHLGAWLTRALGVEAGPGLGQLRFSAGGVA